MRTSILPNGPVELSRGSAATPRSARTGGYAFDLVITQLHFPLVSDSTHKDHPSKSDLNHKHKSFDLYDLKVTQKGYFLYRPTIEAYNVM
jgi:hypothetical protein